MNKVTKHYMKELKLLLPIHGQKEKQLLQNISLRLQELTEKQPEITYEEICVELGEPKEIVAEYFDCVDTEYLSKKLRVSFYIKSGFIYMLVISIIALGMYNYHLHKKREILAKDWVIYGIEYIVD